MNNKCVSTNMKESEPKTVEHRHFGMDVCMHVARSVALRRPALK